jgi:uncharacterized protein YdeI (BOF family)
MAVGWSRGETNEEAVLAAIMGLATTWAFAQNSLYGGFGSGSNSQSHPVQGYTAPSGTYVQPHQQTNPNSTQMDNYSARGNVNPYTGQVGTRTPRY